MESRAKILGHSVHQILIVFPLGLLATAVIFDIVYLSTHNSTFGMVAYWLLAAGLIGGLIAAPFGFWDWLGIPSGTRAKSVGLAHATANVVALLAFLVSWLMRRDAPASPELAAQIIGFLGAILAVVGGWLGGELVERLGVGVYPGAHLDSPSSLSHRPATEDAQKQGS